ncbi:MAG: hypothetical protein E6H51_04580 [Betaproteobacteria bacterium]|nr:MAG: hypothetical protein E6H51_04580 [Betaproteobacteria bacterium]
MHDELTAQDCAGGGTHEDRNHENAKKAQQRKPLGHREPAERQRLKLTQHPRAHHDDESVSDALHGERPVKIPDFTSRTSPSPLGLADLLVLGCVERERAQRVFELAHGGLPLSSGTANLALPSWCGNYTPPLHPPV